MKTTEQWWKEVSNDTEKMIDWLKDQYHGELTAKFRINNMARYNPSTRDLAVIRKIANDEGQHAEWVRELLETRGIPATVLRKEERYWDSVLPATIEHDTFTYMCAVAHLAETMRLERITLLASDTRFEDIAAVFSKILPDEEYHARIFGEMSTEEDIKYARVHHNIGMNAIGLLP